MKRNRNRKFLPATCLFTDREEPQKAFWKKYDLAKKDIVLQEEIHVLSYYGIGGIGKTQLLYQLCRKMNETLDDPHYVLINFESSQDSREVLTSLKNLIEDDYNGKFTFPLFELGLYIHSRKMGMRADSLEAKKLTDNLFLNTLMPILGFIPVVSVAASVISALDQLQSGIGTYLKNHRQEMDQMEQMEADELKRYLPLLFAQDLSHNLENAKEPLVIFMDTYERLVNELSTIGMPLENDLWIRGKDGIVQNTINVLWVIAGREKLKWDIQDRAWIDGVEQHILGNLSLVDSNWFLDQSGIADGELRYKLYELTDGTPMYLDICVERYRQCIDAGIEPAISEFGGNTQKLITRFVRYMDDSQKSIVYMLAFIGHWDDALIQQIGSKVLKFDFTLSYKRAKNLSFIIKAEDGSYYIHQTVGEVLRNSQDELFSDLRAATAKELAEYYSQALEGLNPFSPGYAKLVQGLLHAGLLLHQDRDALMEFYESKIMRPAADLGAYGQSDRADAIFDMLWDRAVMIQDDLLYAFALREWAYLLFSEKREPERAEEMAAEAVSRYAALLGEEDIQVADTKLVWAFTLHSQKRYEEALELEEFVLARRKEVLPADDPKILSAMLNLSATLYKLKEYQRAAQLTEYVYSKRKETLGEEDPKTISAMKNLAITKAALGEQEAALHMKLEAFVMILQVLGPEDPQTLSAESTLADSLRILKHYEEALKHKRHVYAVRMEQLGPKHALTLQSTYQLSLILDSMKRHREAAFMLQILYDHYSEEKGKDHNDTIFYQRKLGEALVNAHKYQEALPHWESLYAHYEKTYGKNHYNTIHCLKNYGKTLFGIGDLITALPQIQKAYENCLSSYGHDHYITISFLEILADLLMNNNLYEKALIHCQTLYQIVLEKSNTHLQCRSCCRRKAVRLHISAWHARGCFGLCTAILPPLLPDKRYG